MEKIRAILEFLHATSAARSIATICKLFEHVHMVHAARNIKIEASSKQRAKLKMEQKRTTLEFLHATKVEYLHTNDASSQLIIDAQAI